MYELTCKTHTGARYLTKNPWERSLHFVEADPAFGGPSRIFGTECPCPFHDLLVVRDGDTPITPVPVNEFRFR